MTTFESLCDSCGVESLDSALCDRCGQEWTEYRDQMNREWWSE